MATLLADAIRQGTRSLLGVGGGRPAALPVPAPLTSLSPPPPPLGAASLLGPEVQQAQELQARIQAAIDETLEYHLTHRPPNTARNYAPKQREWKA
jgi:hypothetical protein